MRIRLMGTRTETADVAAALRTVLDVREVSEFYPNRGVSTLGRLYLDVGGVLPVRDHTPAVTAEYHPEQT